jgi:hypothetical protein
VRDIENSYL